MKSLKPILFLLITTLLSCSAPNDIDSIQISKASITATKSTKKDMEIAFIYDYNTLRHKLEWKALKVKQATGNQLVDAINTFILQNKDKGLCPKMKLVSIDKDQTPIQFSFSGLPKFKTEKDSSIFWTAMDMTIRRNSQIKSFEINRGNN